MSGFSLSAKSQTQQNKNVAMGKLRIKEEDNKYKTISSLIRKLGISPNMSDIAIKAKIFEYYMNDQFQKKLDERIITGSGPLYIFGNQKGTKLEIQKAIYNQTSEKINQNVRDIIDSVKKNFENIRMDLGNNIDKQKILNIKTQKKAAAITRGKLVEDMQKRNQGLIDAIYKQGRLESAMRSQQSKFLFQKDILGAKFQQIKQNYASQIIKNQKISIMRDLQIQAIHQYRATNRQHLSMMFQKQQKIELDNSDQKDQIELLNKKNEILRKLLEENKAIRGDLNKGTESLIELLRRNGLEVRNITQEQAERLQKSLADAAARLQNANKTAADKINNALNKAAQDLNTAINSAGAAERGAIDAIIDALEEGKKTDRDTDEIFDKPRPPPPPPDLAPDGIPWNCKNAPCNSPWRFVSSSARSKRYPEQGPITIWRCALGAHFCSSNNEHGNWTNGLGQWIYLSHFFEFN
jgi:hypothetical protein